MKTIRQIPCLVCGYSFTASALASRSLGNFKADVRLCNGRKGLPHIAWDDLNLSERELLRRRLLAAIQAAVNEGIIDEDELEFLVAREEIPASQIPMAIKAVATSARVAGTREGEHG